MEETQIQLHEHQILSNFVVAVFPKNLSVHRQATIHKLLFVLLRYLWSTVDFTSSTREELRLSLLFAGHHHCMVLGDCSILSVLKQLRDMMWKTHHLVPLLFGLLQAKKVRDSNTLDKKYPASTD